MEASDPEFKPTLFHDDTLPDHFDTKPFAERIVKIGSDPKTLIGRTPSAKLNDFKFQRGKLKRLQSKSTVKSGIEWFPYNHTKPITRVDYFRWNTQFGYEKFMSNCQERGVVLGLTQKQWIKHAFNNLFKPPLQCKKCNVYVKSTSIATFLRGFVGCKCSKKKNTKKIMAGTLQRSSKNM